MNPVHPISAGPRMLADSVCHEWAALASRVEASPFVHPGWVLAWAEWRGAVVELIQVRRDGALVAALPIVRSPAGLATPTDWHTPIFEAIALDDPALRELATSTAARQVPHLRLGFLDAEGATLRVFTEALEDVGYRIRRRTVLTSPLIRLAGTWEDFLATWPSKKRSDLRRRRRRLEELGHVSLEVQDGASNLDDLLTEGFEVEASGWKGTDGTAILTEGSETMYRMAARWAASEGYLRLGFLRLDGQAIAFDCCFEIGGIHYLVKTGFRPNYSALAPGKLLRAFMIEQAFTDGLTTYDFVGGSDAWKLEWTQAARTTVTVDAYSGRPLGRIAHGEAWLGRGAHWIGKRIGFRR